LAKRTIRSWTSRSSCGRPVWRWGKSTPRRPAAGASEETVRLHEEAGPVGPGQHPADRGEQGPVSGLELGTQDLAAEHGELVTQDKDLQILGGVPAGEQGEQLDGAAQREVGEIRQHQGFLSSGSRSATVPTHASRNPSSRLTSEFAHPTGARPSGAGWAGGVGWASGGGRVEENPTLKPHPIGRPKTALLLVRAVVAGTGFEPV
jgi:hypothetical protein